MRQASSLSKFAVKVNRFIAVVFQEIYIKYLYYECLRIFNKYNIMSANRRDRRKNKNRKKTKYKKDTISKKDKIYGILALVILFFAALFAAISFAFMA